MNVYDRLLSRLRAGDVCVIDGGTGTELERRGVPQLENAWNGGGTLSHPDLLREIHLDYIKAGAQVVISNTFATSRHALADAGQEPLFEQYTRQAVQLAGEARAVSKRPDILVAGGISYWSWTGQHIALDVLAKNVAEQARIMADSGADLLMLEMMIDIDKMMVALRAAQTAGLPVWVGISLRKNRDGALLLYNEDTLVDALIALRRTDVPLVSIMHTRIEYIDACLDVVAQHWDRFVGVYAHSGEFEGDSCKFETTAPPESYALDCQRWLDRGVSLIGGCCGMGPEHIQALAGLRHSSAG
jgi:S-methylmethionine-dependent homocysteine/selenocysteine methylase